MAGVQYQNADNINQTPVSLAAPLPVTNSVAGAAVTQANPLPTSSMALPSGATPLAISSGNVANAIASATLAAASGKTTYIRGFSITPGGATAAALVTATLVGLGNTLSFTVGAPAGVAVMGSSTIVNFGDGMPASAVNTAIVLSLPALGSGNTSASVSIWGYQL